ncbi:MAG TPA: tetraacyldisaccharide 4'-kinase, partial [Pyrinomonadaceae bacterium]
LGNPENFFVQLQRERFNLVETLIFPDHYFYSSKDAAIIERKAKTKNAQILLTTAKDAVKLKDFNFGLPCFVVEIGIRFDDENGFRRMIQNA